MQINRLFEIVYILLEKKTITAKELAERFEVSTRTIYRDIDILSNANFPIYASKGKGGGISLLEDYVLNKSLLSEEEQNQILFGLQGLGKLSNIESKDTLEKMSTIFKKEQVNWIEVEFSNWGNIEKEENTFQVIKESILKKRVLEFTYYNTNQEEEVRQVEPLQIWFKSRSWYLKAYCRKKEDERIFKITRMKNLQLLEETFTRKLTKEEAKKEIPIKTIGLALEISKNLSYRVYDEFPKETIQVKPNGNFLVTMEYPENDWLYGYLLSFGEQIKVISPKEVASKLQTKIEKMLKNYII